MTEAGNDLVEPVPMPRVDPRERLRPSSPSTMSSGRSSSASATAPIRKRWRAPRPRRIATNERSGEFPRRAGRAASARPASGARASRAEREAARDAAQRRRRPIAPQRADAQAAFDLASLPPIEFDHARHRHPRVSAPGVPAELTRAALRRAWTADPAIRDFVGLAENAWDFTDPDAMPGFGPLESTTTSRRMIAQIVRRDRTGARSRSQPTEPDAEAERFQCEADRPRQTAAASSVAAATRDRRRRPLPKMPAMQVLLQRNKEDVAMQHDVTEVEASMPIVRRSHGGALPR